jgi:hypothetical protein
MYRKLVEIEILSKQWPFLPISVPDPWHFGRVPDADSDRVRTFD